MKFLKKLRCKILFCCRSKCSITADYQDNNNENYIIERVSFSTMV